MKLILKLTRVNIEDWLRTVDEFQIAATGTVNEIFTFEICQKR